MIDKGDFSLGRPSVLVLNGRDIPRLVGLGREGGRKHESEGEGEQGLTCKGFYEIE